MTVNIVTGSMREAGCRITTICKCKGYRSTGYKISSKHDTTPCRTSSVKGKDYLSGGQAVKAQNSRSKFLTAVAGVSTESIGVTSP